MQFLVGAIILFVAAMIVPTFLTQRFLKIAVRSAGVLAAVFAVASTSFVIIDADEVGHLKRIYGGGRLAAGKVLAAEGENGPQARVLPPGFNFEFMLRIFNEVERRPVTEVPEGHYGIMVARDGRPLREGQFLADGWNETQFSNMLNAAYFLKNGGQKGPQLTVLRPGKYRLNRYLFDVVIEKATTIRAGEVGVVRSNVTEVTDCAPIHVGNAEALAVPLVPRGCKGVWNEALLPGTYYINDRAYDVTIISTRVQAWTYKGGYLRRTIDLTLDQNGRIEQRERTESVAVPKDAADSAILTRVEGWLVPLELRALVQVTPENAPMVVAAVGGIEEVENRILTPALRSVVRTEVQKLKVFDLLDHRRELEDQVEKVIRPEGNKAGVAIKEVRFGDPVIPPELLTSRLREQLARQLQKTYGEEKKAQDERIRTEKARAEADKQPDLVAAEIAVKVAAQEKEAQKLRGEGQKLELQQVAEGQRAQADVLGADRVMELAILEKVLAKAVENPEIIKVPQVLVGGGQETGLAGAAAILGASNLAKALSPAAPPPAGR
ncbi:MAG: hypothetical protein H6907_12520 [Hyphomicrobiales bacterium]|nr:hypothetical protein [Hyphomicrobiales bacterium]MCP5372546.1 hypothetical protein [Hyphomicrobiales bacterium]